MSQQEELIRIATAGSVDDGKSTLLGRLLLETDSIATDTLDALTQASRHRGEIELNLAHITDGLRAEREQNITIDVAYRYMSIGAKRFIIADTPGHQQYTRNMVTGASTADAVLILVDVQNGVTEQTLRHLFIASLLRVPRVMVVVNKLDLVRFAEEPFREIERKLRDVATTLTLPELDFLPVSALGGDNVVSVGPNLPWHQGPTVLEYLGSLRSTRHGGPSDLRFPIQHVIRPNREFRGYAGQVASGRIRVGDEIVVLPAGTPATIRTISDLDGDTQEAGPGTNVVLQLDRDVDVSRGDMMARPRNLPEITTSFEAVVCWMGSAASKIGRSYAVRHTTREVSANLVEIVYRFDLKTLHREYVKSLKMNDLGRVVVQTGKSVFLDTYEHNRTLGSFLLVDAATNEVAAAGMVTRTEPGIQPQHIGGPEATIWLTGLSGAGKSTIADALAERLKLRGEWPARLDGDDLRTGLNSDLGFSTEDRSENLRRAAQVAKLYAALGHITIASFITPTNVDRARVREIIGHPYFEVYVKAKLETCETRDPKGHYRRARSGEMKDFTGIGSAFEEPDSPDLVVDTEETAVEEAVELILNLIQSGIS